MNFDEPTFAQRPALLGTQQQSPEREQFDSTQEDVEEEKGGVTSALDAEIDASTGEETEASGHPARVPSAERCHHRNCAMQRKWTRRMENFEGLKISVLVSHYSKKLLRRMPIPIGIGTARSRMPWSEAMMLPRSKKQCSHPWRGWPGTMPR